LHNTHPARVSSLPSPPGPSRYRARGTPGLSRTKLRIALRASARQPALLRASILAIDRATPRFHSRRRARAQLFMRNPLAASASLSPTPSPPPPPLSLFLDWIRVAERRETARGAVYNRAEMNASSNNVESVSRVPRLAQRYRHYRDNPPVNPSGFPSSRREISREICEKNPGKKSRKMGGRARVAELNDRDGPRASGIIESTLRLPLSLSLHLASPLGGRESRCAGIVSPPRNWDGVLRAVIYDRGYEKGGRGEGGGATVDAVRPPPPPPHPPLPPPPSARGPPNANCANYGAAPLVIPVGR